MEVWDKFTTNGGSNLVDDVGLVSRPSGREVKRIALEVWDKFFRDTLGAFSVSPLGETTCSRVWFALEVQNKSY